MPVAMFRFLMMLAVIGLSACSKAPQEATPEKAIQPAEVEQRAQEIAMTLRANADSKQPAAPMPIQVRLPLDQAIAQQRQAARNGDMRAGVTLGERLLRCRRTLRERPLERVLFMYKTDLADIDTGRPELAEVRRKNTENRFLSDLETYEDCKHAEAVPMPEAVEWLRRAGTAGDKQAQLAYARYALEQFPDRNALIRDPAEAKRRSDLARTWTEQLVGEGREDALVLMTEALSRGSPMYADDREKQYTYGHVLSLVRAKRMDASPYARRKGEFDRLWNAADLQYDRQLTPAQIERINHDAREIYLRSFATPSS